MNTEVENKEILIPGDLSNDLMKILLADEKANLLLRGYVLGKGLVGNIKIIGEFKVTHQSE